MCVRGSAVRLCSSHTLMWTPVLGQLIIIASSRYTVFITPADERMLRNMARASSRVSAAAAGGAASSSAASADAPSQPGDFHRQRKPHLPNHHNDTDDQYEVEGKPQPSAFSSTSSSSSSSSVPRAVDRALLSALAQANAEEELRGRSVSEYNDGAGLLTSAAGAENNEGRSLPYLYSVYDRRPQSRDGLRPQVASTGSSSSNNSTDNTFVSGSGSGSNSRRSSVQFRQHPAVDEGDAAAAAGARNYYRQLATWPNVPPTTTTTASSRWRSSGTNDEAAFHAQAQLCDAGAVYDATGGVDAEDSGDTYRYAAKEDYYHHYPAGFETSQQQQPTDDALAEQQQQQQYQETAEDRGVFNAASAHFENAGGNNDVAASPTEPQQQPISSEQPPSDSVPATDIQRVASAPSSAAGFAQSCDDGVVEAATPPEERRMTPVLAEEAVLPV